VSCARIRAAVRPAAITAVVLSVVAGCGAASLARSATTARGADAAARIMPARFLRLMNGPHGGSMWAGVIPNTFVPEARRPSAVYLPPHVSPDRRYPLIILLHGFRGSPYGYAYGLRFAQIADDEIASHRVPPFVAIMPAAGTSVRYDGEWAGAWERFVIDDVLRWAARRLPVRGDPAGRAIGGDSAGGYGAVDITLRHPGVFGTAESWSGYFEPIADGPLTRASPAELRAHDPTLLVQSLGDRLRRLGTRFYLSAGTRDGGSLRATRAFAAALRRLGLPVRLVVRAGGHNGRFWRAQLPAALEYGLGRNR
jgi:enterochelin esterase-like enzyme